MEKLIKVRVHPKAKQERIEPLGPGTFEVWTTAPPDKGKANDAVRKLLSEHLGIAPSRLSLVRGHTSREKYFAVLAAKNN